jgi:hypothetical protein
MKTEHLTSDEKKSIAVDLLGFKDESPKGAAFLALPGKLKKFDLSAKEGALLLRDIPDNFFSPKDNIFRLKVITFLEDYQS